MLGDGSQIYSYDARGRMKQAQVGGTITDYLVNAVGHRVKTSNANETRYYLFGEAGKPIGEYDENGQAIQELIWLGGAPVAVSGRMPRPCAAGEIGSCVGRGIAYIWSDHLNTPRELTIPAATLQQPGKHTSIWKWDSLPFGETPPNDNPSGLGVMTFNHRFPGQYYDKWTGLNQNWHRDYDPKLGRYVQSDPLGLNGGLNTYAYVKGRPLTETDARGLDDVEPAICGSLSAAECQRIKDGLLLWEDKPLNYLDFNCFVNCYTPRAGGCAALGFGTAVTATNLVRAAMCVIPRVNPVTGTVATGLSLFQALTAQTVSNACRTAIAEAAGSCVLACQK